MSDTIVTPGTTALAEPTVAPDPKPESDAQRAAREAALTVPGVHALGTQTRRRLASAMGRVPGSRTELGAGVNVEAGSTQAAIDLSVVLDHGVVIAEVSRHVRRAVIDAVREQTGLTVVEVNVDVIDMHAPGDPEPGEPEPEEAKREAPEQRADDAAAADRPVDRQDEDQPALIAVDGPESVPSAETTSPDPTAAESVDPDVVAEAVVDETVDRLTATPPEGPVTVTETVVTTTVIEPSDDRDDSGVQRGPRTDDGTDG